DDLDEIASAVGELRRQTKLADEDELAAINVDRQDGDRRSRAQQVARFDALARASRAQPLVGAKSAGEKLALGDRHVGGLIGERAVCSYVGAGHLPHINDLDQSLVMPGLVPGIHVLLA